MSVLSDPERLEELRHERSLVLIKPDAVARHIVGEIITRFERKGLKMVGMKLAWPTEELVGQHYTDSDEWLDDNGQKTYDSYVARGVEPPMQPREFARATRERLMEALTAGPVVALVLEGAHVIEVVRKMRGAMSPQSADVGTIGFDYSLESYELADSGDWAVKNIIHGSDSPESAAREIGLWFKPDELYSYDTAITQITYTKDWHQKRG